MLFAGFIKPANGAYFNVFYIKINKISIKKSY